MPGSTKSKTSCKIKTDQSSKPPPKPEYPLPIGEDKGL